MRTYRVAMYPTGSTATDDVTEYLVEVEDHQRGDDAAHKAMLEHPGMDVLYWGLKHHALRPLYPASE